MKKVLSVFVFVFIAILLSGCGQINRLIPTNVEQTVMTKTYHNVTKEQIYQASGKMFELLDGSDFHIAQYKDGLMGTRSWLVFIGWGNVPGADYIEVKAVEKENSIVEISTKIYTNVDPGMYERARSDADYTERTIPPIRIKGKLTNGTAAYNIFWARLDYLLGLTDKWMTCDEQKERLKAGIDTGEDKFFCSFVSADDKPEGVK
jgi:hypothetical protein